MTAYGWRIFHQLWERYIFIGQCTLWYSLTCYGAKFGLRDVGEIRRAKSKSLIMNISFIKFCKHSEHEHSTWFLLRSSRWTLVHFSTFREMSYGMAQSAVSALWRIRPLLDNARNTHAANNTRAVFSVVRAVTIARQQTIHAAKNIGVVFSVLWSDTRLRNRS
jgi:hypothetical protein